MNLTAYSKLFSYQLLMSLRSRESLFFTLALPPFMYVLFGLAFNVQADYATFLLPGMIGSMLASDGLYAVGPVLKQYHTMGIVRYFKTYPQPLADLFSSFVLTRLVFVLFTTGSLMVISNFLFDYFPDIATFSRYLISILVGFSTYGLLALALAFWAIKDSRDRGISSILYFMSIFLTDAFFVVSKMNGIMDFIGYLFPLKVVLKYMRGEGSIYLLYSCIWLVVMYALFALAISRLKLHRK